MFRIMVRSCPGSSTGVGVRWAILISTSAVALHGIIFAQRVTFPILGHQEATKIRMPGEANAKQIENFALEIIGAGPQGSERLDGGAGAIKANLQPNPLFVR